MGRVISSEHKADVIAKVASGDEQVRARISRLVSTMLDEAEEMLVTAPPPVKIVLMRTVIPAVMREMREEEKDDEIEALRGEITRLTEEIRDSIANPFDAPARDDVELPVDGPR